MSNELGKISREFFTEHVLRRTGSDRKEVIVAPRNGVDTGIVDIGGGKVMVLTTDPIFIDINLGMKKAAWFAFHIIASDLCTSGIPPQYLTVDYNLPPEITDDQIDEMLSTIDSECRTYGISVVTGHTARYAGVSFPMVGGATMIGIGDRDRYITSEMSRPGDRIIVTKSIALEAAVLLAHAFPDYTDRAIGQETASAIRNRFYEMSTVREAMISMDFGLRDSGVTSMHDVTEGGLAGALYEIAEASGNGLVAYENRFPIYREIADLCAAYGIDPTKSISEGTLLLTVRPERSEAFIARLKENGIQAADVGEILPGSSGTFIVDAEGKKKRPEQVKDEFWKAIASGIERGLK